MLEAWQRKLWTLPKAAQLDQQAEVTPLDIALARIAWMQAAPTLYIDLLEATPEE